MQTLHKTREVMAEWTKTNVLRAVCPLAKHPLLPAGTPGPAIWWRVTDHHRHQHCHHHHHHNHFSDAHLMPTAYLPLAQNTRHAPFAIHEKYASVNANWKNRVNTEGTRKPEWENGEFLFKEEKKNEQEKKIHRYERPKYWSKSTKARQS